MITLLLMRHGETGYSGRYLGTTDLGLSQIGEEQLLKIRSHMQNMNIDKIFCSPMRRCRDSLELLQLQQEVCVDADLREIDFGCWEGKSSSELAHQEPELLEQWAKNPESFIFPGGEAIVSFRKRIHRFCKNVSDIVQESDKDKTLLVVSHGGVIRNMLCVFLGMPLDQEILFRILPGGISMIRLYREGALLEGLNIGGCPWQE